MVINSKSLMCGTVIAMGVAATLGFAVKTTKPKVEKTKVDTKVETKGVETKVKTKVETKVNTKVETKGVETKGVETKVETEGVETKVETKVETNGLDTKKKTKSERMNNSKPKAGIIAEVCRLPGRLIRHVCQAVNAGRNAIPSFSIQYELDKPSQYILTMILYSSIFCPPLLAGVVPALFAAYVGYVIISVLYLVLILPVCPFIFMYGFLGTLFKPLFS